MATTSQDWDAANPLVASASDQRLRSSSGEAHEYSWWTEVINPWTLRFKTGAQESAFLQWYGYLCTRHMDYTTATFSAVTYLWFIAKVFHQSNSELYVYMYPTYSLVLLFLNMAIRVFPLACLATMSREQYIRWRHHITFAVRSMRIVTHLSDNTLHGHTPQRLCSYHKTILLNAMLLINPVMLPIMMQLPFFLHLILEVCSAGLLAMAALWPHGLCAQLRAQLHTVQQQDGLLVGDVDLTHWGNGTNMCKVGGMCPTASSSGWLHGELAEDWPVCVSTAHSLDSVASFLSRALVWDSSVASVASYKTCESVCLFGIVGLILPTSILLYMLELRLRCRFYLWTTRRSLVPEVKYILLQQGLSLLALFIAIAGCSWETAVLLAVAPQHHT